MGVFDLEDPIFGFNAGVAAEEKIKKDIIQSKSRSMKNTIQFFFLTIASAMPYACTTKTHDHSGNSMDTTDGSGNQVLYNQVMDIHDEVMPKTEHLYNLSKELKAKMAEAKTDEEKQQLQVRIAYLDSVNNMMMDWMHEFRPPSDTTDAEVARAYYETHLEKVKKVREAILLAVEKEGK
jgi:hypothetical protein